MHSPRFVVLKGNSGKNSFFDIYSESLYSPLSIRKATVWIWLFSEEETCWCVWLINQRLHVKTIQNCPRETDTEQWLNRTNQWHELSKVFICTFTTSKYNIFLWQNEPGFEWHVNQVNAPWLTKPTHSCRRTQKGDLTREKRLCHKKQLLHASQKAFTPQEWRYLFYRGVILMKWAQCIAPSFISVMWCWRVFRSQQGLKNQIAELIWSWSYVAQGSNILYSYSYSYYFVWKCWESLS